MSIYHIAGDFGHAVIIAKDEHNIKDVCKGLGYITYVEKIGASHEDTERTVIVKYKEH